MKRKLLSTQPKCRFRAADLLDLLNKALDALTKIIALLKMLPSSLIYKPAFLKLAGLFARLFLLAMLFAWNYWPWMPKPPF